MTAHALTDDASNRPASLPPHREPSAVVPHILLMDRLVDVLIQKTKSGVHWPEIYERAAIVLRQVGLPTRRGLLAAKRLRNAERYASADDFGAAVFELRLIRTQLA